MKILLVSPFDFSHPGGVNEHIIHLDQAFRSRGHDTRVLTPRSDDEEEADDGHFYRLGATVPVPSNGSTARITLSPFLSKKVKQFLTREQFDIIHLHEPFAPTLPMMVLAHSTAVNVGTFHAARTTYWGYLSGKPLLTFFNDRLDARIAVSRPAMKMVSQYFPASYEIIPNGIDTDQFRPDIAPIEALRDGRPNVLFVGRFNESRKGLKYLLRAFALVRQEFPEARLIVVGPGTPSRFERDIERCGPGAVEFVGAVPKQRLPAYYAAADVFCAPSTGRESFGIVLLEAMAAGKPVIASDIQGYTDVVRHDVDGLLVERKSPEALAMAIVHVLADRDLRDRLGQAGRLRALEYSWPVVAGRVLDTYQRALNRRTRRPTAASATLAARG